MAKKTISEYMETARDRRAISVAGWDQIYDIAARNVRWVSGDQWDSAIRSQRNEDNRPALTFDQLHVYTQSEANRARQQRPQVRIMPGDSDASVETAEFLEGKVRHIQYASQAESAYDMAVEYAAAGGIGFYKFEREYVNDKSFEQEPRVKRVLDWSSIMFDPSVMEPDFSDAVWCFEVEWINRDDWKARFPGVQPVDFDSDAGNSDEMWSTEKRVCVARYWWVEKQDCTLVALADGTTAVLEDMPEVPPAEFILQSRKLKRRVVHCDLIDGEKPLEESVWPGRWIPIVPVLGKELWVDGKRVLKGMIDYAIDAQKLINAYVSGVAELCGDAQWNQWIGAKGSFKDEKWRNGRKTKYLEYDPVTINGQPAPPPTANQYEPPIQALMGAAMMMVQQIKTSVGYVDNVQPTNTLSGVAVQRREGQQNLTNFHFEDNLARSQWHAGRIMVNLYMELADTPRLSLATSLDGKTHTVHAVTRRGPDGQPMMPPAAPPDTKVHILDIGEYDVTISTGPTYATKREEESEQIGQIISSNPALFQIYGDLFFELRGFPELAERARLTLPPQIQQAIAQKDVKGLPPQIQAVLQGQEQTIQKLQQGLQQVLQKLQSKQLETSSRVQTQQIKTQGEITVQAMRNAHDHAQGVGDHQMDAIREITQMLHEAQMSQQQAAQVLPQQPAGGVQ